MSASNGGEPGLDPHGAASEHPAVDVLLAAAVTAMHILVVARTGRADVLSWVESPQRQTLYGAAAGVIAIIGSLGAIALAQYHPGDGDRSKAVRRLYGRALRRNWRAILTITGLSSGLCLVALAIDRESDPLSCRFIFEFALALWALRFCRLVWLLDAIFAMPDLDSTDEDRPVAPPLGAANH